MWRKTVRVASIISGILIGISGLGWALRIFGSDPFIGLIALAATVLAVLVSIAPAMLLVEISEDVEDLRGEIRYLQEKLNKAESNIKGTIEQSEGRKTEDSVSGGNKIYRTSSSKPGEWSCRKCGKTNPAIITRCSCGTVKGEI